MRSLLRFLLLCLMVVALPVQGLAATGAVHCAAMHERMQTASMHLHHDGSAHDHAAADAQHEAAPASADLPQGQGGSFKCSACAACCVALGLPAGAIVLPHPPAQAFQPAFGSRDPVAFLTGGPERPPRAFLA